MIDPSVMMTLTDWQTTWNQLGLSCPDGVFADLIARYGEPHRAYHTREHLRECFAHFQSARHLAEYPAEIELALWFHDAIYDPRRNDNEERSCELAVGVLSQSAAPPDLIVRVGNLILATQHSALPTVRDEQLLVDVDLSILAASPERFEEYERQIRQEYSWVPWTDFRLGRSRILDQFISRSRIYSTGFFHQKFEQPARANLEKSFQRLAATPLVNATTTPRSSFD